MSENVREYVRLPRPSVIKNTLGNELKQGMFLFYEQKEDGTLGGFPAIGRRKYKDIIRDVEDNERSGKVYFLPDGKVIKEADRDNLAQWFVGFISKN